MTKIAETRPNPSILEAIEKLRALGFNPVLLSSIKYNLKQLRTKPAIASKVRRILKSMSKKSGGIYRKRIAAVHKAYLKHQEFCDRVDSTSLEKLAKMLRVVAILA